MSKDAIGNELHEGDLVQVNLDAPRAIGRVKSIGGGGLAVPGQQGLTPVTVLIDTSVMLQGDADNPIFPAVLRLVDPAAPGQETAKVVSGTQWPA